MFMLRMVMGTFVFSTIFYFSVKYLIQNPVNFNNFIYIVALVFSVIIPFGLPILLELTQISVSERHIIETFIVTKKQEKYSLDELVSIERVKVVQQTTRGNITDGYHRSILLFKGNRKLYISPDEFENYNKLISTIKNNIENLESAVF